MITAVVFDLDGVIVDSEQVWDEVREDYVRETGGTYTDESAGDMMGMSSPEWSRYMAEALRVPGTPEEINAAIVERMLARYGEAPPLLPGALEAVRRVGASVPLAIASSSNRELIDVVLRASGLAADFRATVSSEEVPRGKPSPDVYLEAARQLGIDPSRLVAVEDSSNGLRAAHAAGMGVIAIPNGEYPPAPEALALADVTLGSLAELDRDAVLRAGG